MKNFFRRVSQKFASSRFRAPPTQRLPPSGSPRARLSPRSQQTTHDSRRRLAADLAFGAASSPPSASPTAPGAPSLPPLPPPPPPPPAACRAAFAAPAAAFAAALRSCVHFFFCAAEPSSTALGFAFTSPFSVSGKLTERSPAARACASY